MRKTTPKTKHGLLREWIISNMDAWQPGARLPTEFELARRFGISRQTVHKVISRLQDDGYVTRRRSQGTFANRKSQRVRTGTAGANGAVIIAFTDWFSYDIWAKVEAAENEALKRGLRLVNLKITRQNGYSGLAPLAAEFKDLRGIIVVPPGGAIPKADLALLDSIGVPVVALCALRHAKAAAPRRVRSVAPDSAASASAALGAALAGGVKKLAYIRAEPINPMITGFTAALKKNAVGKLDLVIPSDTLKVWADSPAKAARMTARVLDRHPDADAFLFDSFPTALAGNAEAVARGRTDLLFIVNGEYFGFERYLTQRVVQIAVPIKEIVRAAFSILHPGTGAAPREKSPAAHGIIVN